MINAIDILLVVLVLAGAAALIYWWRARASRGAPPRSTTPSSLRSLDTAPDVKVREATPGHLLSSPMGERTVPGDIGDTGVSAEEDEAGETVAQETPEETAPDHVTGDVPAGPAGLAETAREHAEDRVAAAGGPASADSQSLQEQVSDPDDSQSSGLEILDSTSADAGREEDSHPASESPALTDPSSTAEISVEASSLRESPSADQGISSLASNRGLTDHQYESGAVADHETEAEIEDTQGEELGQLESVEQETPVVEPEKTRRPPKYRGLARMPPKQQEADRPTSRDDSSPRDRSLPIEVRLMIQRGGFCEVSLIATRISSLPEDLIVRSPDGSLDLRALQDEWYQDITPRDISRVLREGIEWWHEGDSNRCRWLLSGRELYVLAARSDLRGYVSQPCLELGREHVALCTDHLRGQVEEAIRAVGARPSEVMDSSLGAPPGWVVFRGIIPEVPVSPIDGPDIFNALRPLPRIDITLEGGIRLEYATWLEGYAPSIRVYGDADHTGEVLIDGERASCGEADGSYRVNGWDSVGSHTVWCGGLSKSYSIVPFTASWELWDAYTFPVSYGAHRELGICGPLVRECSREQATKRSLLVPETHPVVLGAVPGQCFAAARCAGVRGIPCIASPPFAPVWALPPDPLHCDKRSTSIILIGEPTPPELARPQVQRASRAGRTLVDSWCQLILDASRKGLRTRPDTEPVRNLWKDYKLLARRVWRARK